MENFESRANTVKTMEEVSAALFELRDAFVELSLSLKDWQFETDLEQRKIAWNTVHQLMQKIAPGRGQL